MQADFTDKRVLVTGGSRGIGRGAARAFLKAGARVAVNGRTADSTAAGISAIGNSERLLAAPGDVATAAGCEAMVGAAIDGLGGLDVLVNSAGIGKDGTIEDFDEAAWDETLDINLKGTFFCIRTALAALRASQGNIVNVASDAGLMGQVGLIVYGASKGGVVNMTRAMALELAPDVRVNCVCPGYVDTDMVRRDYIEQADDPAAAEQEVLNFAPMGRMATVGEIATAILYLASDGAGFITGSALQIEGGSTAGR
ncbi:MAG: SDR family oxidoreductase [Rhodospirillaceae bacterium]|mgnify:CR=1 FL=1|jgi:NAD(P)-dependent dehydrogenase (short-subunit alcohol dehydrogenase family)|nr:SDR family oxidoreductase [Rhodospirillaceae bacterium]MBT4426104.1 SDR family oxidoreductase [Rhodospirillaceae bacterium]MBT5037682.1 SDR family oxidoreductase [Rhodospirillaceae bacterium]MBT7293762.1 SDR family oxidoreductase [Rhodospirillaceae bacterium]